MSYIEIDLDDYKSEIDTDWLIDEIKCRFIGNKEKVIEAIIETLRLNIVKTEKLKEFIQQLKQE